MDGAVCREYTETPKVKFLPSRYAKPVLTALAVVSVLALLVATLWPLNPNPRNEVSWLSGEDGVLFSETGTIFSAAEFPRDPRAENEAFSLELWLTPVLSRDSRVICAFYVPENPGQFVVRQDLSDITVVHRTRVAGKRNPHPLVAGEVIEAGRSMLVTVTAGPDGTTLYINGKAKRSSRVFGLSRKDLAGELVVGNSPVENISWVGTLRGLAIYKNAFSAREAADHYSAWRTNTVAPDGETMLAMYRFRERSGSTVKNEIQPGIDLYIPRHFKIWRQNLLTPPWREFQANRTYAKDVIVNVIGFVPLGLVLFPYFEMVCKSRRPLLMSYLSGALLSLTIEILQSFLPTRYSGWTDVITNSTGTLLGAGFYLTAAGRNVLSRLFLQKEAQPAGQRADAE